jgi:hypothetical protein
MEIIIQGPAGCGKSMLVHHYLIPAFRGMGRGAEFYEEGNPKPTMVLSGPNTIKVFERLGTGQ